MESKPFPYYIEDWILWLGNKRDNSGNTIDFSYYRTPPVKLANYDVGFVNRSAEAIDRGTGFTERQLATAKKIVTKYRRQILTRIKNDPEYLNVPGLPPHRLEIREVNRSFTVNKLTDCYEVRFPYNPQMVDGMFRLSMRGTNPYDWDKENRVWRIGLTEINLNLLRSFVSKHSAHGWYIDAATQDDFAEVDAIQADPLAYVPYIDLDFYGKPAAFNTNPHLKDVLAAKFDWNQDPANAAFRADCYGMRVGPKLTNYIETYYSKIHAALLTSQHDIYDLSQSLDCCLTTENLAEFMRTVQAKYWVFVSFGDSKRLGCMMETAMDVEVAGEKLFFTGRSFKNDIIYEINSLNSREMVLFTDNTMMMKRLAPALMRSAPLRLIYLYGTE